MAVQYLVRYPIYRIAIRGCYGLSCYHRMLLSDLVSHYSSADRDRYLALISKFPQVRILFPALVVLISGQFMTIVAVPESSHDVLIRD